MNSGKLVKLIFSVVIYLSGNCAALAVWETIGSADNTIDEGIWETMLNGGTVEVKDDKIVLDAAKGSVHLLSRQFFDTGKIKLSFAVNRARCFVLGLKAQGDNSIYLRGDLPDYDGMVFGVRKHGKSVVNKNYGGVPRNFVTFTFELNKQKLRLLQESGGIETVILDTNDSEIIPDGPFQLQLLAYSGAQVKVDLKGQSLHFVAPPQTAGQFVPSVWDKPTDVTAKVEDNDYRRDLTTIIANELVQLKFRSKENGFGLGSMYLKSTGREAISAVDRTTKFWQVDVRLADGNYTEITNLNAGDCAFVYHNDANSGGVFIWDKIPVKSDGGTISVRVDVKLSAALLPA